VRYFDLPMPDLGEASIACIVSLTFLCIGLLVRTGGHIAIEVSDLVRERRVKFAVRQLANLGILLFVATFGVQAYNLLASALRSGEASIALRIPLAVPFAALVIGLVLAAFHTLMNVVRDVRVLRAPGAVFENRSEGGEQA
jgi:TRAP-type C4-dicarboxylate transport system permease small subunit